MQKYIIINGITADGAFTNLATKISDKELALIKPVIEAVKNFKPYSTTGENGKVVEHTNNFPGIYYDWRNGEKSARDLYKHLEGFALLEERVPEGIEYIGFVDVVESMLK